MAQIFFILGQGRSCTGLLAQLLARHPRLAVAPDSLFVLDMQRRYGAGPWNRRRVASFCRELGRLSSMAAFHLDERRLAMRLNERDGRLTYADVCRLVYTSYALDTLGCSATKWVGCHNSLYALQIDQLDRLLPGARYVHVTRDYRDEIYDRVQPAGASAAPAAPAGLSWPLRAGKFWAWLGWQSALEHPAAFAQRWKAYNRHILDLSRRAPERCLWLRYEDLLSYPEHELSRICRFLEIPFDSEMVARPAAPAEGRTATPPTRFAADPRWQQLPEATLHQAEAVCGEFAERFGYRASTRGYYGLSLPERLLTLYGSTSVVAERLVVQVLPARLRARLLGAYRRLEGSLRGRELPREALP